MLRPTMNGHKPRGPPKWRVILTRIREQHWRQIEEKEVGQAEQWPNGINHTLEAMLHWRDPVERLRVLRRRRKTLIDDNPSSS
jgi:hypothetical protein